MLVFPQLSSGALAQFPIKTKRTKRTIVNTAEDGSRIVLSDPNQSLIEWSLQYSGLSDAEASTLSQFFQSTEGSLQTFTFPDPTSNLLAQSETLNQSVWQGSGLLTMQTGVADPLGTTRATRLTNTGTGTLTFSQTLSMPGSVNCCFSAYLRSGSATSATLSRTSGGNTAASTLPIKTTWQRQVLTGLVANGGSTSVVTLAILAGATLDVFGFQVDSQNSPSQYVQTFAQSGVYTNARFKQSAMTMVSDGPNRNRCAVAILTNG